MITEELKQLIRDIPKAEVHSHVDSVPPELLLRFGERNKVNLPFDTLEGAEAFYKFKDLEQFLDILRITSSVIQTEEDYYESVVAFGKEAHEQNIIYRECMFTYASDGHENRGIAFETLMEGYSAGRKTVKEKYGLDLRFIAELDRTQDLERNMKAAKMYLAHKDRFPLVAIGYDYEEIGYPASRHAEVFSYIKEQGMNRTAHAGEAAGPESVWESIRYQDVQRIDHGVRSIQDDELIAYLVEKEMLLTVCPISNIALGEYPSLKEHPVHELMKRGVKVCVNSDDSAFFGKNLNDNLIEVADTFDLTEADVIGLVRNALLYNFSGKEHLKTIDNWLRDNNKEQYII
jgi:adenosine deaminase